MLTPKYPLRTARLLLRPYAETDFDFLYSLVSRPEVARYTYWSPRTREESVVALEQRMTQGTLHAEGGHLVVLVALQETGEPVGDVQLHWTSREHQQGEIGYLIHPGHAGNGYATEAAEVMLRLGFEELGLHRIVGRVDGRNVASTRVLEHLRMRREACLRHNELVKGEWTDEVVYAMLAEEWQAHRAGTPAH